MSWPQLPDNELSSRSPALDAFVAYLLAASWTLWDQDPRTSLWRPPGYADRRNDAGREDLAVVLPASQDVTDYDDRIYQALRVLSFAERRSLSEVTGDIIYGPADTVAVRLTPDAPSGQAPLSLAFEAISSLRSYVIGSGAALEDKSLVLPPRRSRQAESYANDARLSTLPGSFIMSLTLPLVMTVFFDGLDEDVKHEPTNIQEQLVDIPPQPFGRLVTNRMATAAKYAQELAEEVNEGSQELRAFGRPSPDAANATELEALSGLGGSDRKPYQVRFAQSPLASERTGQAIIRVTPGQQRVMADAAEYLRSRQPRNNLTVQGLVVNLSRDRRYEPGQVVIQGVIDDSGKDRRVHVELTPDDYDDAVRAHSEGFHVTVTGDLESRGNWKWIRHPRSFAIVPGLHDDDT